jgi:hypothetical protein
VSTASSDQGQLEPMIGAARAELAAAGSDHTPAVVLADAGYWAGAQIRRLMATGITALIPPDAHTRAAPNPRRRGGLCERMRELLASTEGGALYKRRMTIIEPIFG